MQDQLLSAATFRRLRQGLSCDDANRLNLALMRQTRPLLARLYAVRQCTNNVPAISPMWEQLPPGEMAKFNCPSVAATDFGWTAPSEPHPTRYTIGDIADVIGVGSPVLALSLLMQAVWDASVDAVHTTDAANNSVGPCRELLPGDRKQICRVDDWDIADWFRLPSTGRACVFLEGVSAQFRFIRHPAYPRLRLQCTCSYRLCESEEFGVEPPDPDNAAHWSEELGDAADFGIHRFTCWAAHGPPPALKMVAAHSCNNKACLNPMHLRWLTHADNFAEHGENERRVRHAQSAPRLGGRFVSIFASPDAPMHRVACEVLAVDTALPVHIRASDLPRHHPLVTYRPKAKAISGMRRSLPLASQSVEAWDNAMIGPFSEALSPWLIQIAPLFLMEFGGFETHLHDVTGALRYLLCHAIRLGTITNATVVPLASDLSPATLQGATSVATSLGRCVAALAWPGLDDVGLGSVARLLVLAGHVMHLRGGANRVVQWATETRLVILR
jgi:hypothetical protein